MTEVVWTEVVVGRWVWMPRNFLLEDSTQALRLGMKAKMSMKVRWTGG